MIEARGLSQVFHTRTGNKKTEVTAVAGVDLDVGEGEVVGFLGPNGAGKTTTLRMLTTLLKPTAGTASVAGYDVVSQAAEVRRRIGYVSQSGSTGQFARAGDEVVDHGMLYGMSSAAAKARGRELFEQLELDGMWSRQPRNMSGGQRRRLDIAMGLIHEPTLVFLDEPTTGLDPQARANLWTHIRALRAGRGATVFLTTHYLDEADALSDRILVIDHGRIVAADTADNLKATTAGDLIELHVAAASQWAEAAEVLAAVTGGSVERDESTSDRGDRGPAAPSQTGATVRTRAPRGSALVPELVRELDRRSVRLSGLEVKRPTLDDVFLTLTGRSLRDGEADAVPDGHDGRQVA